MGATETAGEIFCAFLGPISDSPSLDPFCRCNPRSIYSARVRGGCSFWGTSQPTMQTESCSPPKPRPLKGGTRPPGGFVAVNDDYNSPGRSSWRWAGGWILPSDKSAHAAVQLPRQRRRAGSTFAFSSETAAVSLPALRSGVRQGGLGCIVRISLKNAEEKPLILANER